MKISVDLSLYPLNENFIPPIKTFINTLKSHEDLEVICNTLSTQIYGEFDVVMAAVNQVLKQSFQKFGHQVLVAKYLKGDRHPKRIKD